MFDGKRPFFNKSSTLYVVEFTFKKGLNEEIYENARNEVCVVADKDKFFTCFFKECHSGSSYEPGFGRSPGLNVLHIDSL